MRWLFLLIIFDVTSGGISPRLSVRAVFPSEAECQSLGKQIAQDFTSAAAQKSYTTCIPEGDLPTAG